MANARNQMIEMTEAVFSENFEFCSPESSLYLTITSRAMDSATVLYKDAIPYECI